MNLKQMEYFIAAAENLNFTRAAEKCFISQTAMTQQIRSLEEQIGVPLFLRDSHHVELTTAGRIYLAEARKILEQSRHAAELARLASEGIEGEITVGYMLGAGHGELSEALTRFHQTYPGVRLHVVGDNLNGLKRRLITGECDLIAAVTFPGVTEEGLISEFWMNFPIMAVLPKDNPLSRKETLTYKDLKNESFIMMEPENRPKEQMEESILIYERGGYVPEIAEMEKDPEALLLLVSMGIGISILPEYIVRYRKNDPLLAVLPLVKEDGTTETVNLSVVYRKDNTNPTLSRLLRILR